MLLKNILNGNTEIDISLIIDDAFASGDHILREILSNFKSRNVEVHYVSCDGRNTEHIEKCNYKLYDCFDQSCNWFGNIKQGCIKTFHKIADTLIKEIPSNQQLIVVDSVTHLFLEGNVQKFFTNLNRLSSIKYKKGTHIFPVILILHDYNDDNTIHRQLKNCCNVIFSVSNDDTEDKLKLLVTNRKASGRIISENYTCWLDSETEKLCFEQIKNMESQVSEPDERDISELTTFKLTLEDKEIESRNKLVLPYVRRQEEKGKIFYEPDANDDWDDEDPDDDLEI